MAPLVAQSYYPAGITYHIMLRAFEATYFELGKRANPSPRASNTISCAVTAVTE